MKESIKERIHDSSYRPMQIGQWLEETKSEKEKNELKKVLNEMIDNYDLALDAKERVVYPRSQGIVKGLLRVNPKGFGFIENEQESVYVNRDNMNGAMDSDQVVAQIVDLEDGGDEGRIIKVETHGIKYLVGTIKRKGNDAYFLSDKELHHKIKVKDIEKSKLADNTKVQLEIIKYGSKLECIIKEVIGNKYDPGIDIQSLLVEYGIELDFNKAVMQQAKNTPVVVEKEDMKGRQDLRDELIITIDGEDAKDLDDAISIKRRKDGFELGVHIADVSYYVKEGSAIDQEALRRGTSVYVVDRVVPMLPQLLSNGICSLNPKEDRLAMSCVMKIDKEGTITSSKVFPSVIRTTERMTYTAINAMLAEDKSISDEYPHLKHMVANMLELSDLLSKRRTKLGAIDFDTKEAKIIVNKKGKPTDIVIVNRGRSERIIEDFMIAANESVASYVKWLEIPSIYRVHEQPEPEKIRDFAKVARGLGYPFNANPNGVFPIQLQALLKEAQGSENHDVLAMNMLRSMQKAHYDTKPIGHFGLALEDYLHFTSPIRRYPDLMVHRMLRKYVFEQHPETTDIDKTMEAAKESSIKERKAIEAERAVDDMKKAEYMEKSVGKEFDGKISSVTRFGMFVELDNTVEGLVHVSTLKDDFYVFNEEFRTLNGQRTKNVYKMGSPVRVKCTLANRYKRQIDFEIVGEKKEKTDSQATNKFKKTDKQGKESSYKRKRDNKRRSKTNRPKG